MSYFIFSWEEPWKQRALRLHMHTMYVCVSDDIVFLRFVCLKKNNYVVWRQLLYLIPIGGESNIEVIQTRIWSIEF